MQMKYANSYKAIIVAISGFANVFCLGQSRPKILTVDKFQKGKYNDQPSFFV